MYYKSCIQYSLVVILSLTSTPLFATQADVLELIDEICANIAAIKASANERMSKLEEMRENTLECLEKNRAYIELTQKDIELYNTLHSGHSKQIAGCEAALSQLLTLKNEDDIKKDPQLRTMHATLVNSKEQSEAVLETSRRLVNSNTSCLEEYQKKNTALTTHLGKIDEQKKDLESQITKVFESLESLLKKRTVTH